MLTRFRAAMTGAAALGVLLAAGPTTAELVIRDREHLERLAQEMDAQLAEVRSVRAVVKSQTFLQTADERQMRVETGPTNWISDGAQYRYETEERHFATWAVSPIVEFKSGGRDAESAGAEVVPVPEEQGRVHRRRLVRALSDRAVIEFDPDRPDEVQIGSADQLHAALNIERFRHDPRHAGLTVLGASLSDILRGGSWRLRPEDVSDGVRRTVSWGGVHDLEGRPHEVVEVDVAWDAKGHRARRSYSIWIDPSRNFTVPLMVGYYELDGNRSEFERLTVKLSQNDEGRWLPRRAEHRLQAGAPEPDGSIVTVTEIDSITVNRPVDPDELHVAIPPGAQIYDHTLQYRFQYTLGNDEQVVEEIGRTLAERTRATQAGVGLPITIDGAGGPQPIGWVWWLLGGGGMTVGLLAFVFFALRDGEGRAL